MNDLNNIIQSLWIGDRLSIIEQLSISSFLKHGHSYHLYVYTEVKDVPEGVLIFDANKIIPSSQIFRYKKGWGKGSLSGFANYFRYVLLLNKGGWWFDLDMICIRPIDIEEEVVISSSYERKWGIKANNCALKFPIEHPFMRDCVDYCHSIDLKNQDHGETGPHLIQKICRETNLSDKIAPYYFFNPISWYWLPNHIFEEKNILTQIKNSLRSVIKPQSLIGNQISEDSYTIHLWNEVWRHNGWEKEKNYHPSSLIEKLKREYL